MEGRLNVRPVKGIQKIDLTACGQSLLSTRGLPDLSTNGLRVSPGRATNGLQQECPV